MSYILDITGVHVSMSMSCLVSVSVSVLHRSRVHNITGSRWFVTFIDEHTHITWVFLMKEKSEVGRIFEIFHNMVQIQFQSRIQVLRTNNGHEYYNLALNFYLQKVGIVHQSSCADTP